MQKEGIFFKIFCTGKSHGDFSGHGISMDGFFPADKLSGAYISYSNSIELTHGVPYYYRNLALLAGIFLAFDKIIKNTQFYENYVPFMVSRIVSGDCGVYDILRALIWRVNSGSEQPDRKLVIIKRLKCE